MAQDGDIYGIGQEKLDYVQGNLGTKNPQAMRFSQGLGIRVLAGAEGLGLRCRSGRLIACVPLARIRPSARGFGVDVETEHQRAGKGLCCPVSQNKPRQRGAVLVLRGKLEKRNYQLP